MLRSFKAKYVAGIATAGTLAIIAIACNNNNTTNGSSPAPSASTGSVPGMANQVYQAQLINVNSTSSNTLNPEGGSTATPAPQPSASLNMVVQGDTVSVQVNGQNFVPNTSYYAYIYSGTRCPSLPGDDKNGDGIIDPVESFNVTGPILIPLNQDLLQSSGIFTPAAQSDGQGTLNYAATGSMQAILADLVQPTASPSPSASPQASVPSLTAKLSSASDFSLAGKVVEIEGLSDVSALPSSVQALSDPNATVQVSFLVACGKLVAQGAPPSPSPSVSASPSESPVPSESPSALPSPSESPMPSEAPSSSP